MKSRGGVEHVQEVKFLGVGTFYCEGLDGAKAQRIVETDFKVNSRNFSGGGDQKIEPKILLQGPWSNTAQYLKKIEEDWKIMPNLGNWKLEK